jgi:hypothetical protein
MPKRPRGPDRVVEIELAESRVSEVHFDATYFLVFIENVAPMTCRSAPGHEDRSMDVAYGPINGRVVRQNERDPLWCIRPVLRLGSMPRSGVTS